MGPWCRRASPLPRSQSLPHVPAPRQDGARAPPRPLPPDHLPLQLLRLPRHRQVPGPHALGRARRRGGRRGAAAAGGGRAAARLVQHSGDGGGGGQHRDGAVSDRQIDRQTNIRLAHVCWPLMVCLTDDNPHATHRSTYPPRRTTATAAQLPPGVAPMAASQQSASSRATEQLTATLHQLLLQHPPAPTAPRSEAGAAGGEEVRPSGRPSGRPFSSTAHRHVDLGTTTTNHPSPTDTPITPTHHPPAAAGAQRPVPAPTARARRRQARGAGRGDEAGRDPACLRRDCV